MNIEEFKLIRGLKAQNILLLFVSNLGSIIFCISSVIVLLNDKRLWWIYLIFAVLFHTTLDNEKKGTT